MCGATTAKQEDSLAIIIKRAAWDVLFLGLPRHDNSLDPPSIETEKPASVAVLSPFDLQLLGFVGEHLVKETADSTVLGRELLRKFLEVQILAVFP